MKCNIKNDLLKIQTELNIDKETEPIDVIFEVLKIDNMGVNNPWFFNCIYESNQKLEDKARMFLENLLENVCMFSLVIGYPKNGKSTFVEYIKYLNNQDPQKKARILIEKFEFEKHKDLQSTGAKDYIEKVRIFWEEELYEANLDNSLSLFIQFRDFYYDFILNVENYVKDVNGNLPRDNKFLTYIRNLCKEGFNSLYKTIKQVANDKTKTKTDRENIITSHLTLTITEDNSGNFFSLLILYKIFKHRFKLLYNTTQRRKFVFILDNIDDYLNQNDVYFLQYPQIQLSDFIFHFSEKPFISRLFSDTLKQYMKKSISKNDYDKIADRSFSFKRDINITYVFRTQNFLAFSNLINEIDKDKSQSTEKYLPTCIFDIEFQEINSINYTNRIIGKRLLFGKKLLNELGLVEPKGYKFLEILSQIDKYSISNGDIAINKSVFSLWNGDKEEIIDNIYKNRINIKKKFFPYEDIIESCFLNRKRDPNNTFLVKGVYIYFFLFLIKNSRKLNNFFHTINKYKKTHKIGKSIRRFILNYIINNSEIASKPNNINEIDQRGVGLYDLLNDLTNFIDYINKKAGENIYRFSHIEDFFEDIYNDKISFFAHFFSIYKSQIAEINGEKTTTIYYNLEKELNKFNSSSNTKSDLNNIRLFNNHNASFISRYLISHFELYSFFLSEYKNEKDNKTKLKKPKENKYIIRKPLLFTANLLSKKFKGEKEDEYEFHSIIENVFTNVAETINSIVDFYTSYLIEKYPPHKFIDNQFLSIIDKEKEHGNFQFRVIITRHITYIETFRLNIMNDTISKFTNEQKCVVNQYLLEAIKRYIKLYKNNYMKILNKTKRYSYNPKTILDYEYDNMLKMEMNIDKALLENKKGVYNIPIQ